MAFATTQDAYRDFRAIVAERSNPVVAWVGAGLSRPAGVSGWSDLRDELVSAAKRIAPLLDLPEERDVALRHADTAGLTPNLWDAFSLLQKLLGKEEYRATIRRSLGPADQAVVPATYKALWQLRISGILNLNIDRLAARAFSETFHGHILHDFSASQLSGRIHLLRSDRPWMCHLHGVVEDMSTWVFTTSELEWLQRTAGYNELISTCLTAKTVLFIGISADDIAVGSHLMRLSAAGLDLGGHFWITHRGDRATWDWAQRAGLRVIKYTADGTDHSELFEMLDDLKRYVPFDEEAAPVVLEKAALRTEPLPEPVELERRSTTEIRSLLNSHARAILSETTDDTIRRFEDFSLKYSEEIHRAWYVSTNPPKNDLLGYTLLAKVAKGAFGNVYRATSESGESFAIKILHEEVRENPEMLHCFRRGVRSMRILSNRTVSGVVKYHDASEIPAMVAMDFVEGIDLGEAVSKRVIGEWHVLLRVATSLTDIIRSSHKLPERVLHRDIRPSNIMLKNCWPGTTDWEDVRVVVLDFDLSWHLDAFDVSVTQPGTANGFLAPEQSDRSSGVSTRNAAVDSYGLGMTLYFMRSGVEPRSNEHRYSGWSDTLEQCAEDYPCKVWVSLPRRFMRVIHNATRHSQEHRWDMARIDGELCRMREAELDPASVQSAELWAEELAARAFSRRYRWDSDTYTACHEISGIKVEVVGNELTQTVSVRFAWLRVGGEHHQQVRKWLPKAQDKIDAIFRRSGWRSKAYINTGQIRGEADIEVEALRRRMDAAVESMQQVLQALDFR